MCEMLSGECDGWKNLGLGVKENWIFPALLVITWQANQLNVLECSFILIRGLIHLTCFHLLPEGLKVYRNSFIIDSSFCILVITGNCLNSICFQVVLLVVIFEEHYVLILNMYSFSLGLGKFKVLYIIDLLENWLWCDNCMCSLRYWKSGVYKGEEDYYRVL